MAKVLSEHWKAWLTGLEPREKKRVLGYFKAYKAEGDPVLIWPDESATALWLVESGKLEWKELKEGGEVVLGGVRQRGGNTPAIWLKTLNPSSVLLRSRGTSLLWCLTRDSLMELVLELPRAFAILSRDGGPLEGLRGWKEKPKKPRTVRPRRWFSPFILFLAWSIVPAFLFLTSGYLFTLGSGGGWLALILGFLIGAERTLRWLGESIEIKTNRVIYLRTNILKRTHRRWTARWEDIQSIEVSQEGWIKRFFGLSSLRIDTRSNDSALNLPLWSRVKEIRSDLQAMRDGAGPGAGTLVGLRSAYVRHGGQEGFLVPLEKVQNTGTKAAVVEDTVFHRHPLTLILQTAQGWSLTLLAISGFGMSLTYSWIPGLWLSGFLGIYGLGHWFWRWWDWANDTYSLTGTTLADVERKPFWLGLLRREIPISGLQTAEVDQNGILPILFDYGNVVLSSAGGGPSLTWINVRSPAEIQETIFALKKELALKEEDRKFQERWKEMSEAVRTYDSFKKWGLMS